MERLDRIFARRAERDFSCRIVGGCREGCVVFRSRLAVGHSLQEDAPETVTALME
jgi:hypothetical protein